MRPYFNNIIKTKWNLENDKDNQRIFIKFIFRFYC